MQAVHTVVYDFYLILSFKPDNSSTETLYPHPNSKLFTHSHQTHKLPIGHEAYLLSLLIQLSRTLLHDCSFKPNS